MNTFSRVAIVLVGMTGIAAAQPKTDAKPPAPTMAGDKAGAMPEMKPAAEIGEMAKAVTGSWKCKGQGMDHTMKMADMTGTMTIKLDLDKYWLHGSFESKMGKEPFHFESFTTYDGGAKKWKRVMVESGGGWSTGEATVTTPNKIDWDLTSHSPMGEVMFRDHEDMTDAKVGAHQWGEFSMDKGKTWTKVYDITCKK